MLIYCVKGVSRSCTVLLAVLMHVSGIDLWTAWKLVKEKRPKVRTARRAPSPRRSYCDPMARGACQPVPTQNAAHARRTKRQVAPNPGFLEQLEAYERRIRGYSSVLVLDDGAPLRASAGVVRLRCGNARLPYGGFVRGV